MLNHSSSAYIEDAMQFDFEVARLTINNIPYHDKFDKSNVYLGLKH